MRRLAAMLIGVTLLGCVKIPPPTDLTAFSDTELAQRVEVHGSQFDGASTYEGMLINGGFRPEERDGADGIESRYFLRTIVSKTEPTVRRHQLYVAIAYGAETWTFYNRAADDQAQPWPVTTIDRTVDCRYGGCVYQEHIAVALPQEYLETRGAAGGFRMRLAPATGLRPVVVTVPANYIRAQLAAASR